MLSGMEPIRTPVRFPSTALTAMRHPSLGPIHAIP
jgi:hypothetical protein